MAEVILARKADSPEYVHLVLADPVGTSQASEVVTAELADGGTFEIHVHGQKEFDVPASAVKVAFPDGSEWKPE